MKNKNTATALEKGHLCKKWSSEFSKKHNKKPTQKQIAKALNLHTPEVSRFMFLANSPSFIQEEINQNKVSAKEAYKILQEVKKEAKEYRNSLLGEFTKAQLSEDKKGSKTIESKINQDVLEFSEKLMQEKYESFLQDVKDGIKQVTPGRRKGSSVSRVNLSFSKEDSLKGVFEKFVASVSKAKGIPGIKVRAELANLTTE